MKTIIFDYLDLFYNNSDPLFFVITKEVNSTIRNTFMLLSKEQQMLIEKILFNGVSYIDLAIRLNQKESIILKKYEAGITLFNDLFKNKYFDIN